MIKILSDNEDPRYCRVSIDNSVYILTDLIYEYHKNREFGKYFPNNPSRLGSIAIKFFQEFPEKLI